MQIPGFQIVRSVGKGGMATVYLAIQESLDREVAIKVMSPFLAEDETFGERFVREAKIVAKLSHPHIIAVYDVGTVDGQFYIAMQYSPGGDLKQKITSGLTEQQAVIITQQIASALQYAHDKGFIHRDVKPANILFDQHGNACLTDFGVAKATSAATTNLTVAGSVIGTPTYMSPEQARGETINQCSDLYSLGVVFYEMLSGQPPFQGDSGVSIAIKHLSEPVPQLPAGFARYQNFVNKLLSKNPQDRFQHGNEIIQELNNIYQYSSDSFTQIMPGTPPSAQATGPHSGLGQVYISQPMAAQPSVPQSVPITPAPSLPPSQPLTSPPLSPEPASPPAAARPSPTPAKKNQWAIALSLLLLVTGIAVYLVYGPDIPMQSSDTLPVAGTAGQTELMEKKSSEATAEPHSGPHGGDNEAAAITGSAQPPTADFTADSRQTNIAQLLRMADQAFEDNNFIYPENQSALQGYRKILELAPDNQPARDGIQRIADHYLKYAREAAQKNNLFLAEQHLNQAQAVNPDDPRIAAVKSEIESAKQQAEDLKRREQLRLAQQSSSSQKSIADKPAETGKTSAAAEKTAAPSAKTASPGTTLAHSVPQTNKRADKPAASTPRQAKNQTAPKTTLPSVKPSVKPSVQPSEQPKKIPSRVSEPHKRQAETPQTQTPSKEAQPTPVGEKPAQGENDTQVATLENPSDGNNAVADDSQRLVQLEKQIKELSQKGGDLLANKKLTFEQIEQAHNYYKEIDSLSPNNRIAKQGYTSVVNACVHLATNEFRRKDYNDARRTVYKGLSIDHDNSKLLSLQRRLKRAPAGNHSGAKKPQTPERRIFGGF